MKVYIHVKSVEFDLIFFVFYQGVIHTVARGTSPRHKEETNEQFREWRGDAVPLLQKPNGRSRKGREKRSNEGKEYERK